jgi:hypothetical protein
MFCAFTIRVEVFMSFLFTCFIFLTIPDHCIWVPVDINSQNIVKGRKKIFIAKNLINFSFKHSSNINRLPGFPENYFRNNGIKNYKLISTQNGDIYWLKNGIVVYFVNKKWKLVSNIGVTKILKGKSSIYLIYKNSLIKVKKGKKEKYKILPFNSTIIDASVYGDNKIAFLTKNGIWLTKNGGRNYKLIHKKGRKIILNKNGCYLFNKNGISECGESKVFSGLWSKIWKAGNYIWVIYNGRFGYFNGKKVINCDYGLIPGKIKKVIKGPLVFAENRIFRIKTLETPPVDNNLCFLQLKYMNKKCILPAYENFKNTKSKVNWFPKVELLFGYGKTGKSFESIYNKSRYFSFIVKMSWNRSFNQIKYNREIRLLSYEKSKRKWKKYSSCIAGFRFIKKICLFKGLEKNIHIKTRVLELFSN